MGPELARPVLGVAWVFPAAIALGGPLAGRALRFACGLDEAAMAFVAWVGRIDPAAGGIGVSSDL